MPQMSLFPENASTIAGQVDALFFFMIAVSAFFGVLIAVLVVVLSLRYRRRAETADDVAGEAVHGSTALEIAWTGIPFVIAMVMFYWGASVYMTMSRPPDDAHEIFVVGKQWMWKLQHLEGRREINELHVPVGQPVKLTMTSEDVIHSFYVPAFRLKSDVVPGRYSTLWFEPTKVGTYHLFCAEYCGTEHSLMIGRVVVLEPNDFQAWLSADPQRVALGAKAAESPRERGAALFAEKGCITCHKNESSAMGPKLAGIVGRERTFADGGTAVADLAYLRESILTPRARIVAGYEAVMPTFQGQIDEEGLLGLIEYIRSLRDEESGDVEGSDG